MLPISIANGSCALYCFLPAGLSALSYFLAVGLTAEGNCNLHFWSGTCFEIQLNYFTRAYSMYLVHLVQIRFPQLRWVMEEVPVIGGQPVVEYLCRGDSCRSRFGSSYLTSSRQILVGATQKSACCLERLYTNELA